MPCSAITVTGCSDYRREPTTMPVRTIVRPLLDTTDLPRSKLTTSSISYLRSSSLSSKQSYAFDTLRHSSPRSSLGIRSTSLSDEARDRSQTRESSRLGGRDSSRTRVSSYSSSTESSSSKSSSSSSSTSLRKPTYVPFYLDEFRAAYAPSSHVIGSSRSAAESRPPKPPPPSDTRLKPSSSPLVASQKEKSRSESTPTTSSVDSTITSSEVNRDENHNLRADVGEPEVKLSGGDADAAKIVDPPGEGPPAPLIATDSVEVKNRVDEGKDETGSTGNEPTETQEHYSPRLARSGCAIRRDTGGGNDNNGLSGLRNIGNTCFLNSVVQCLSNTRLLKDYLLNREYIGEITNTESRGVLIKSFTDVICELWSGEGKIVNTTAFKAQIQKYAPRFMGYNQQDAQEFLRYLLQGLHDDINRVTTKPRNLPQIDDNLSDTLKASESWKQYLRIDNSRIVDLFVGQLKSTLQCTSCGHCSTTFEVFWDLSLPLPSRSGSHRLYQCLDHFTKEEVLDGDEMPTCSQCKTRRKCTKRFSIQKFPKILVLHLKRFSPSERYRKLSATVEFPLTNLDMSAYSSTPQASSYKLYAVSNHSGTAYSGHYTAYCLHPHSGQWHEYNDSRVCSVSSRNVVSSEAYILFYEQSSGITSRL